MAGLDGALALRARLDAEGKKIVFTNGCFDLLHVGHVRYLQQARALGDALVVGLNGDASVRSLKGAGRPLNPAEDRAELLVALECVDAVTVFEAPRATGLITLLRPHVYAKGGDYTVESLNVEERAALESAGARIEILSLVPGKSTSGTLTKIRGGEKGGRKLRIGVLGSGRGTNLEAIFSAIDRGSLEADVALAISDNESSRFLEIARNRGVDAVFVDPGPAENRFSPGAQKEVHDRLRAAGVDLVVLAGFMRRLKNPVLETFASKIINIHPSLLPEFRGVAAWEQALDAGVDETGCTVHLVNDEIDAGEILAQARVPLVPGDTAETLHARIQEAEYELYPRTIGEYGARVLSAEC